MMLSNCIRAAVLAGLFSVAVFAQSTTAKVEIEVVTVTSTYVYPAKITRPAGPFLLVIKNYSPLKQLVMQVQTRATPSAVATALQHAPLDATNGSYDLLVDLSPGTYDFVEPNHPSLKCTITIK